MKKINIAMLFIISIVGVNSCAPSIQKRISPPNLRLRKYNNINVNLVISSGSFSLKTESLGKLSSEQFMSGEEQGRLALESLKFELIGIGFNLVSEENEADAIVEFFIGAIRYDPLVGWIADQAFVKFKDRRTGKTLAFFSAKKQFITPTVNNIISGLSKEIRNNY